MTWLQQWTDALFLHFPVAEEELRPHVPAHVEVDTFAGQAWLSYVFFRLRLRPEWLPLVPGFSSLSELNVRTYLRRGGQRGICFLRMYADNRLAIWASRLLTPLCYEPAAMIDERLPDGTRTIGCRPLNRATGILIATLCSGGDVRPMRPESLDGWLLERYRLFVGRRDGRLLTATVEHAPWEVAAVRVVEIDDTLIRSLGFSVRERAIVGHYSPGVTARFTAFEGVQVEKMSLVGTAQPTKVRAAWLHGGQ